MDPVNLKDEKQIEASASASSVEASTLPPIDEETYQCISESGEKIAMKKSIIDKIPYFQVFFRSEIDAADQTNFKAPAKNENGEYVLPSEIEMVYLKVILGYVESQRPLDLITKLSTEMEISNLIALYDFLLIEKPDVDDLDSIHKRMTEDIKDYTEKICRRVYEHHKASYGRRVAREAAGEFCVGLAMGLFDVSTNQNRQKMFSRMQFILSHPRTFRRRLRHHAKKISDARLTWLTFKQKKILDDWSSKCSAYSDDESDTDKSFTSSDDNDYDSDYEYSSRLSD